MPHIKVKDMLNIIPLCSTGLVSDDLNAIENLLVVLKKNPTHKI